MGRVEDVELPPWADTPRHFVETNRLALESHYVTMALPAWISLVFGPHSRPPLADAADNLFHPYFFESALVGADSRAVALIKEYAACFGAAPVQLFAHVPPKRAVAPHPFQHCFLGMLAVPPRLSEVIAAAYDSESALVTAVNAKCEFVRFGIADGRIHTGRLAVPIPSELEDRAHEHMKIALFGSTVVVSLPWDSAFYVFRASDGVAQPAAVNRVHRERITAIAASGSLFATAAKDFSVRIWRMDGGALALIAFAMKHRTAVKLITINKKLQICVSVGFDGFVLALSTVNGRFLHARELHESDPSLLAFSNFGCVVVAFNQNGSALIKVLDQNLRPISERRMPYEVNCWRYVQWSDGAEYLIAALSNRRLVLLKLPFIDELGLDFQANFAVAAVDCVLKPSLGVLLTDTDGRLFCILPYSQR
jgi:hypothetical protein